MTDVLKLFNDFAGTYHIRVHVFSKRDVVLFQVIIKWHHFIGDI